jgi:hypothetical protein
MNTPTSPPSEPIPAEKPPIVIFLYAPAVWSRLTGPLRTVGHAATNTGRRTTGTAATKLRRSRITLDVVVKRRGPCARCRRV